MFLLSLASCRGELSHLGFADPIGNSVRATMQSSPERWRDLRPFYSARDFAPVWIRGRTLSPKARELVALVAAAEKDGLDPERYGLARVRLLMHAAAAGDDRVLADSELALSRMLTDYSHDLHAVPPSAPPVAHMVFADPEIAPLEITPGGALAAVAKGARPRDVLAMHPLYRELSTELASYVKRWGNLPSVKIGPGPPLAVGATGKRVAALRRRLGILTVGDFDTAVADGVAAFQQAHGLSMTSVADHETVRAIDQGPQPYIARIRANIDRLRPLPANPGARYILVDAGSARLWMYANGKPQGSMRVIVGKPELQTPAMAGMLRFAIFNPYWNVPPDLVRDRLAGHVLDRGISYFTDEHMEALSDWSDHPKIIDPTRIDWQAVKRGQQELRVRQLPGADNMMGNVKFMMPNDLGIYLHDTPDKELFDKPDRRLSAGCVRLEQPDLLVRWVFGKPRPRPRGDGREQRVDLKRPIPVYIVYMTIVPGHDGPIFRPDVYGWDDSRASVGFAAR